MVPSDKPELLEETIAVLAEFAFGIRYKSRLGVCGEGGRHLYSVAVLAEFAFGIRYKSRWVGVGAGRKLWRLLRIVSFLPSPHKRGGSPSPPPLRCLAKMGVR